jgi:hypothetical protein
MNRRTAAALAGYTAAALLSVAAAVWLLQLRGADLRVPFDYRGDTFLYALTIKGVLERGWYLVNPLLGAPGGLELHDFPFADGFHHLAVRALGLFTSDWALVLNLYFLLGFPLIALAALAVFRHFRVSWVPALVGSLLYAFLPARLLKGESHIFMVSFFEVPLALLVVLWVCGDHPPFWRQGEIAIELRGGRTLAAVLIALFTAFTGLYYAFFTICLLLLGGLWGSLTRRSWGNALAGLALTGVIVTGLAVSGWPTLRYHTENGGNPLVAQRGSAEAELNGMKIIQLVLPVEGHRIPLLAKVSHHYSATAPLVNENSTTALGAVGAIGFLVLLAVILLGPRRERTREDLWRTLAVLNLMALLIATVGGFSSVIAYVLTPQIRSYSRMNVVVGFFALFAVVLLLERLWRRKRWAGAVVAPLVLGLGLLDQVTAAAVRPYPATRATFASDAALVHQIEAAVPRGAMIFQLPYLAFPEESTRPPGIEDYDPLRPYFHSSTLRWSYPTMRGRPGDDWVKIVSGRGVGELVPLISDTGFEGLLIDRQGYPDRARALEDELAGTLGAAPLVSPDQRLAFFNLGPYNQRAHASQTPAQREQARERARHPLLFTWGSGFSDPEQDEHDVFRWCSGSCVLRVDNNGPTDRQASIKMRLQAAQPPAPLFIEGDLLTETLELPPAGLALERTLKVPPGSHLLRLRSTGKPAHAPADPRVLIFRAMEYALGEKLEETASAR